MDKQTEKIELCILCGKPTEYLRSIPVNERIGYISGCGQLCADCYEKNYRDEKNMTIRFVEDN